MDFIEPVLPSLPSLSDPLLYPQLGGIVPDAVEFQFNPTLKSVESIKLEALTANSVPKELLSSGPFEVLEKGMCFRF